MNRQPNTIVIIAWVLWTTASLSYATLPVVDYSHIAQDAGNEVVNLAKLVRKGQEIFVEGALRQEVWDDKETGKNRSKLFLKANSWQFTQYKATEERREAVKAQAQGRER